MSKANSEISRDVGTELLFENDRVRVWGMELAPGESSPYHRHESDYVYVYTTPSQISAHIPGEPEVARNYQVASRRASVQQRGGQDLTLHAD